MVCGLSPGCGSCCGQSWTGRTGRREGVEGEVRPGRAPRGWTSLSHVFLSTSSLDGADIRPEKLVHFVIKVRGTPGPTDPGRRRGQWGHCPQQGDSPARDPRSTSGLKNRCGCRFSSGLQISCRTVSADPLNREHAAEGLLRKGARLATPRPPSRPPARLHALLTAALWAKSPKEDRHKLTSRPTRHPHRHCPRPQERGLDLPSLLGGLPGPADHGNKAGHSRRILRDQGRARRRKQKRAVDKHAGTFPSKAGRGAAVTAVTPGGSRGAGTDKDPPP